MGFLGGPRGWNFSGPVWALVLLPLSSFIHVIYLLIVLFLTLPLMSPNSYSLLFLQTLSLPFSLYPFSIWAVSLCPLFLLSVSSPSTVSIEAPLSVLYLRLTSCVLRLHSLLWGREEWIEGLTENSEEANPCLSSHWAHLLLLSCPPVSSRLLCPKTLLWPILSPLPPAAHCASCLRCGVIFMEDVFSEGKRLHTNTTKAQTGFPCQFQLNCGYSDV